MAIMASPEGHNTEQTPLRPAGPRLFVTCEHNRVSLSTKSHWKRMETSFLVSEQVMMPLIKNRRGCSLLSLCQSHSLPSALKPGWDNHTELLLTPTPKIPIPQAQPSQEQTLVDVSFLRKRKCLLGKWQVTLWTLKQIPFHWHRSNSWLFSACVATRRKCELHHMQEDFYKTLKKWRESVGKQNPGWQRV